jgi:hypothetical protein
MVLTSGRWPENGGYASALGAVAQERQDGSVARHVHGVPDDDSGVQTGCDGDQQA